MKRTRNWILFLFVVFVWSLGWSVMKVSLGYVGPLNFALHRFALSALALSPLLVYLRSRIPKDKGSFLKLLLLGSVNALGIISMYWGLTYETSGVGAILNYTQPLFVFCLCVVFLRSEANLERFMGAFIGFSGVIVLTIGRSSLTQVGAGIGEILLLFGAFFWAVTVVYYKKSLSNLDAALTTVVQQTLGATIVAPLAISVEGFSFPSTQPYLIMILYLSVLGSGMSVWLWLYLIREEDVTVLSLSSFLIPMVAVFLGWLLLAEDIQPISLLGMGMILTGLYLTNKSAS